MPHQFNHLEKMGAVFTFETVEQNCAPQIART
jgi:hypothetical protein